MITFKRSFDEYVRNREIINAKSKSSKLRPLPLLRTDTRLVFCNRKLMRTDIFLTRTTKPICNFANSAKWNKSSCLIGLTHFANSDFMLDCPEYTPIRNNYLNLITERFPGLRFLELSPFDKIQFLIGDVRLFSKHDGEVGVICQATFTFGIDNFCDRVRALHLWVKCQSSHINGWLHVA
jgi:hypothetical protein